MFLNYYIFSPSFYLLCNPMKIKDHSCSVSNEECFLFLFKNGGGENLIYELMKKMSIHSTCFCFWKKIIFVCWFKRESCPNVVLDPVFERNAACKSHSEMVYRRCAFAYVFPSYVYSEKQTFCRDSIRNDVVDIGFHGLPLRPSTKIHGNRVCSGTGTLRCELKHVSSN